MKLCNTTGDFSKHCTTEFEKIKELHDAGFRYVDFSMYGDEVVPFMHDNWKEDIKRLKDYAESLEITFVQAHSPAFETLETLSPTENWQDKFDQTVRSIEICKELSIPMTVFHAGVKRNTSKEQTIELNKQFFEKLLPVMEKTGVSLLVENVGINDNNGRYYFNTAERLKEFIEYFNHPLLYACWDIGHGNSMKIDQYEQIKILDKDLYAIHYNDNNTLADEHRIPFLGTTDNDKAIRGLIDIGFKGPFTFECTCTLKDKLFAFDTLNARKNASIDVVRAENKLLFEMGKYLLSTYGIYED